MKSAEQQPGRGAIARAGNAVAVGTSVLVGSGVAVGGISVGEGSGVAVAGTIVGVAVVGLRNGIAEQPVAETTTVSIQTEIINVFVNLIFAIFITLSKVVVSIITSTIFVLNAND